MGNVSKNFSLGEFVPPEIFKRFGMNSKWFINERVINFMQFCRDYFKKPITVNNWSYYKGGEGYTLRGYRPPDTKTGAKYSQHKLGNACDFTVSGMTADEVREEILKNEKKFMEAGLTTLESGKIAKTWIHSDCRNTGLDNILIVGK